MDDDLAVFPQAGAFRAHSRHVFQGEMHDAALARRHGIQAEGLARSLHAFRSDARGHAQLFEAQCAVAPAIDMDFFVERGFETQRPKREMLDGLQHFRAALQQNLLVFAVDVRGHFRLAFPGTRVRCEKVHRRFQFQPRGADDLFQKAPQRIGGCLPVELVVSNEILCHVPLEQISSWPSVQDNFSKASCRALALPVQAAGASGSSTTAARYPRYCWSEYTTRDRSKTGKSRTSRPWKWASSSSLSAAAGRSRSSASFSKRGTSKRPRPPAGCNRDLSTPGPLPTARARGAARWRRATRNSTQTRWASARTSGSIRPLGCCPP